MTRKPTRARAFQAMIGLSVVAALCTAGVALAAGTKQAVATKVTITFTDSKLGISNTNLEAGTTTFVVVNKGKKRHALAMSGPGLKGLYKRDKLKNGKKVTDAAVLAIINAGGNGMPSYADMLSDTERADVIAYLKTL